MQRFLVTSVACTLFACSTGSLDKAATHDDSKDLTVTLEGDELSRELTESPVRVAPIPFVRIGVLWDATAASSLEISTSYDGQSWSSWAAPNVHNVEAEIGGSFVGEFEVPDEATYYRLRGVGLAPTFVSLAFLDVSLSDVIEDGDDSVPFLAPGLEIASIPVNSRASWGARNARCSSAYSPYRLTVHHTVTPTNDSMSPQARLRQIQSFHQDVRGWCDVGYHFLVSRDGRLWEGRPSGVIGSHVGGANSGNVGISFMGTHTSTPITETQLDNVATLISDVTDQYGIDISSTTVKGHRDRGQTSCPGDALYAQLPELVARAQNGGRPDDPPPVTQVTVKGIVYEGSDTTARIPGATVTLGNRTAVTDSIGYYELTDVAAGEYAITAQINGFVSRTITRNVAGTETWASIGLSRDLPVGTATLQGVVYTGSSSANRVSDVTIQLSTGHTLTTDGNGFYKITDMPAGPITITASKAGYPTVSVERTLSGNTTTWGSVRLQ